MTFALFPDYVMAGDRSSYTILVQQKPKRDLGHNPQLDPEGSRIPSKRVPISISISDGLSIPYFDKNEIDSFDVIDENGIYLASLTTEHEFVSFIFTLDKPVEIRINLNEYILQGYLNI